jgi:hypothetical protein
MGVLKAALIASLGIWDPLGPKVAVPETPFLNVEQALVIWDSETHVEHLIRELRFQNTKTNFGYIVPTPTKPEVSKVESSPFVALRAGLPFETFDLGSYGKGLNPLDGMGMGGGSAAGDPPPKIEPVEVIQQLPLKSFTAFVVAARDTGALTKWLADNKMTVAADMEPVIARYVLLGFHFVVLRFDASDKPFSSETVRITFGANAPYYPYVEPTRSNPSLWMRRLAVWYAAREPRLPITLRDGVAVRPWRAGARYTPTRELVASTLGTLGELLPTGKTVSVQTFEDRKLTRAGFSDVVLVPETAQPEDKVDRRDIAAWLDPSLVPPPPVPAAIPPAPIAPPPSTPPPAAAPSPSGFHTSACSYGRASFGAEWMLLLAGILFRRRIAVAMAVAGCKSPPAPPPPAPPAPSASTSTIATVASVSAAPSMSVAPVDSAKLASIDALLRGVVPSASVSVVAQEPGQPWDPPAVVVKSPKPPGITFADFAVNGGLPNEVIRRVIRSQLNRYRFCYQRVLVADPKAAGNVVMRAVVGPDGSVTVAQPNGGTFQGPLPACLAAAFRGLAFPQNEKITIFSVNLRFTPPP